MKNSAIQTHIFSIVMDVIVVVKFNCKRSKNQFWTHWHSRDPSVAPTAKESVLDGRFQKVSYDTLIVNAIKSWAILGAFASHRDKGSTTCVCSQPGTFDSGWSGLGGKREAGWDQVGFDLGPSLTSPRCLSVGLGFGSHIEPDKQSNDPVRRPQQECFERLKDTAEH